MDRARWQQVAALFERASDGDVSALETADPELRAEVEKLLAHATEDDAPAAAAISQLAGSALADPDDARVGTRFGNFRIEALLGRGGMGVVYRAVDERLGRQVALKLVARERGDDRQLVREARVASTVTHANIAAIYEVGQLDGRAFVAMEYVAGTSLRARIAPGGMPIAEALSLARQILGALAAAHAAGIAHRDLKPENVMLAADGTAKVLDFGIAKQLQPGELTATLTSDTALRGTPAYMSPEQARATAVDHRSDLFSLGVVLYELLTGARPFTGATAMDVVSSLLRDTPRPASSHNPLVPPALDHLLARCLAKDAADRFASCADVLAALDAPTAPVAAPAPARLRRVVIGMALLSGAAAAALALHHVTAGSSPAARRELAAGIAALRLGDLEGAVPRFEAARAADPDLASALLYESILIPRGVDQSRDAFRAAFAARTRLPESERALAEALEPYYLRVPAAVDESRSRLAAAAARFPQESLIPYLRAVIAVEPETAVAELTTVVERDPTFSEARAELARARAYTGDLAGAEHDLAACIDAAPDAYGCLVTRERLHEWTDCTKVEADSRLLIALAPGSVTMQGRLAESLAARGAPSTAVAEALRATFQGGTFVSRLSTVRNAETYGREIVEHTLCVLDGDLDCAATHAQRAIELASASGSELDRSEGTRAYVETLVERGELDAAARVAADYLARVEAWQPSARLDDWYLAQDQTGYLASVARRGGALTADAARKLRDTRVAAWRERTRATWLDPFVWASQLAIPAETADDARDALAARADYGGAPVFASDPWVDLQGGVGRTLLLAGRVDEALPALEHAAKACGYIHFPYEHPRTWFFLGEARAATGDTAGACAAYHEILAHWGHAKPRSVTGERAAARAKELGCAP